MLETQWCFWARITSSKLADNKYRPDQVTTNKEGFFFPFKDSCFHSSLGRAPETPSTSRAAQVELEGAGSSRAEDRVQVEVSSEAHGSAAGSGTVSASFLF